MTLIKHPTVRQRRIAAELVLLRTEHMLSRQDLAEMLGTDVASIEQLELCERRMPWLTMQMVLDRLHVEEERREYVLGLLGDNPNKLTDDHHDWIQLFWTKLVATAPPWKRMYVGLNAVASHKSMYQPLVIPGILQTHAYASGIAQHVLRAGKPELSQAINQRVNRATRLTDPDDPLTVHAIISQSALYHQVCAPSDMAAQMGHLLNLMELPNVTVQILPSASPLIGASGNAFVWLGFPRPAGNLGVVYLENLTRTNFLDRPEEIEDYKTAWQTLTHGALTPQESARAIMAARNSVTA